MQVISFIDPASGKTLYCIGPFSEKAQASRAAAGLPNAASPASKRPSGPITKRCWDIFDLLAPSGLSRAQLLAECERQGVLKGTAAAQYSRWSASRGRSARS